MDINLSDFGYLTKSIPNYSIAWLLLSSLFIVIVGYATFYLVTKKEISEKIKKEIDAKAKASEDERICQEKIRWANPSDIAVNGIYYRIKNIIKGGAYVALCEKHKERIYPNWSIDYEYFFNSTLYIFAQYFAWARLMEEDLSIELFESVMEKEELSKALLNVSDCLSIYPSKYGGSGVDSQVFRLQQLAIAELLIKSENRNSRRWMTYPEFLKKIKTDDDFEYHMRPLKDIIGSILPDEYRWNRLNATMEALSELKKVMINLELLHERRNHMPPDELTKGDEHNFG